MTSHFDRHRFFEAVHGYCEGQVEIRALPVLRRRFFDIGDFAGFDAFCEENKRYNLYAGVGTRDGFNGRKENLVNLPAVYCDIDFKDTPVGRVKRLLSDFPLRASMVVFSGNGLHMYWLLKEPADANRIKDVENVNCRIAARLEGDFSSIEAARVLRIPETMNWKYPKPVVLHKLQGFRYDLEDFEILPEVKTPYRPQTPTTTDASEIITKCDFIKHCHDEPSEVSEPLWYAMLSNIGGIRPGGVSLCHKLSKDHPGYSRKETDQKILHALDSSAPHTCAFIKSNGFKCEKSCKVKSPAGLLFHYDGDLNAANTKRIKISFG